MTFACSQYLRDRSLVSDRYVALFTHRGPGPSSVSLVSSRYPCLTCRVILARLTSLALREMLLDVRCRGCQTLSVVGEAVGALMSGKIEND